MVRPGINDQLPRIGETKKRAGDRPDYDRHDSQDKDPCSSDLARGNLGNI
jgi:hypothetical protein